MKRINVIVALLLVACFLAACGAPAAEEAAPAEDAAATEEAATGEKVLYAGVPKIVPNFYAPQFQSIGEGVCLEQVYDTLITQNADGSFAPSLAESWEISEDGMTYTFHLRNDVKWSDGEPFTAKDVLATFEEYNAAPGFAYLFPKVVKEALAADDYTFVMNLNYPYAGFLPKFHIPCTFSIMPAHLLEKYGDEYGTSLDKIAGTGPYILTDWEPNVSMHFIAKPDYFKGEPDIKEVVCTQINDVNATCIALQSGDLDISLTNVTGGNYDTLKADPNIVIEEAPDAWYTTVNMNVTKGIFQDKRVRQAVAYAINKDDMLTIAQNGHGNIIRYQGDIGSIVVGNPDEEPKCMYEQDFEKAKALIKEAGVEGATVTISSYSTEPYISMDTYLQSVLTQIGLDAKVAPAEKATFLDELRNCKLEIYVHGKVDPTFDMDTSFAASCNKDNFGNGGNYSFYENDRVQELVDEAAKVSDIEVRKELYKEAIDIVSEEVPYVPLYAVNKATPHRNTIVTENPRSLCLYDYKWA